MEEAASSFFGDDYQQQEQQHNMNMNMNMNMMEDQDHTARHTQFLDLTNGEGGERASVDNGYYDDEDEGVPTGADDSSPSSSLPLIGGGVPATPGRVVETGQEHTGRWTREEHEAFLSALKMYGKEWKKVAAKVKTRTVVQTRTHAQKYFQKLQKATGEDGGMVHVEMGVASEFKKPSRKSAIKPGRAPRSSSTQAAADLLARLPSIPSQPQSSTPACVPSAPEPEYSTATPESAYTPSAPLYPSHGFNSGSISDLPPPPAYVPWGAASIAVPDPDSSMRRGLFPEPSPAATGKRKLAELAAAQMLAGVIANAANDCSRSLDGDVTPPPYEPNPMPRPGLGGLSLQIVNPETLGITYDETRKRSRTGDPEPTTPWDGQLEQLVSEEKKKEVMNHNEGTIIASVTDNGCTLVAGNPFPHIVCGPGSSFGRSPLHKAVCDMDMAAVHQELSDSIGASSLHRMDEVGYYPIHSACSLSLLDPENSVMACEIARLLISAGSEASVADSKQNTPLHWAARSGDADLAQLLLMRNCPPDTQNEDGDTALHWAMRAGRRGMNVVRVLIENGARPAILNNNFKRAVDVSADGFSDDKPPPVIDNKNKNKAKVEFRRRKTELMDGKRDARSNLLIASSQSRTLVLHHPECLEHIPKSQSDWEVPDRVRSIMRRVVPEDTTETTGIFPHEVAVSTEFDRAKLDFLSRVHSSDYLAFVNDLSKELSKRKQENGGDEDSGVSASVVPFTPMVQKTVMKGLMTIKKESHSDTSFSAGSLRAARRAAGAVQHAVDCVLVGRHRNAFCVVRPPGHHAGVKGLLAGGESCGFCIFNNVAAGALHAISDERLMCQRCAIVDIDVHHGNGTEEIVKRCHDPGKLLFFSIHLYDHDRRKNGYSFYPGTGVDDDVAHNVINVPIMPLWKEVAQTASSCPSPIPPSSHNTRHKARKAAESKDGSIADDSSESGAAMPAPAEARTSDTESESASLKGSSHGSSTSRPAKSMNMGRLAYRRAIQNRLLPSLRAFNPDLILISAGFDAAKGDVGNARHYLGGKERMGLDLEPEDYAWTTRKILEIADICCQGRVVSVLEGGYGRSPVVAPSTPGDDTPKRLDKAFFSECAIRHLQAMIDPYDVEQRFGKSTLSSQI